MLEGIKAVFAQNVYSNKTLALTQKYNPASDKTDKSKAAKTIPMPAVRKTDKTFFIHNIFIGSEGSVVSKPVFKFSQD